MKKLSETVMEAGPAWATDVQSWELGTPDEWVSWSATLATVSPVLGLQMKERNHQLSIVGWQYTGGDGDIPAGTPTLELITQPIGTEGVAGEGGPVLYLEDVPKLIRALTEAVAKMTGASSWMSEPGRRWKLLPEDELDEAVVLGLADPNGNGIEVQMHVPDEWESLTPVRARALAVLLMDAADAAEAAREGGQATR